jgi:POT family proton-dependent oligopeptide transporter
MLKNHPRGLIVAFFANMGERFGFYTMMAILTLFLQAKYGLTEEIAGSIYSWFYFGIYGLALVGGILADATNRYKTVILAGIIIMFIGYVTMAIPGLSLGITVAGLFTIAFGNGLFKGNLQAVVGQMYDDPKYTKYRDNAYLVFYMGINVGAFFAPFAATAIRNWMLKVNGFLHDGSLPAQCHQYLDGTIQDVDKFQTLANNVSLSGPVTDLGQFAQTYLDLFSKGYNYAFGIAAAAMVISLLVYVVWNKLLPVKQRVEGATDHKLPANAKAIFIGAGASIVIAAAIYLISGNVDLAFAFGLFAGFVTWIVLTASKEERPKVISLLLVFVVVIFFWMSFHQNGLTLTFFARDYTVQFVGPFTYLFFELDSMLAFIAAVAGLILLVRRKSDKTARLIGAGLLAVGVALCYYFVNSADPEKNPIAPEVFQSFNPLFIVSLTFVVMGIFAWLNKRGKEPSTPKKIGIGMVIAAVGFVVVLVGSIGLISPKELGGLPVPDTSRVTPYWLVSSYLVLTIAELFLSPMGLSFVSKVAPPRFQGIMQGGWLFATALGNKLLFVGSFFWGKLELWQLWAIFVVCCLLSAAFIFSILKRLERATQ